jgi:hypothetical protein
MIGTCEDIGQLRSTALGQNADAILQDLGYSGSKMEILRAG